MPRPQVSVPMRTPISRPGLTLPELLITFAVGAIVASLSAPMISRSRDQFAVRGARNEVVTVIEAARAASVQRSRPARFIVRGNQVMAIVDTGGAGGAATGTFTVLRPQGLDTAYRVRLAVALPTDTLIAFDSRGFANPRLGHIARIRITGRVVVDSVCLTSFGQLLPKGCMP
jgi:Tfp pilus assembly protein FimT